MSRDAVKSRRRLSSKFYNFYLSSLEAVWTQCAGMVVTQMSFDIDDIRPCSTHPYNIKTFSCQVVARNKRSFLALRPRSSSTALDYANLQNKWHSQYNQNDVTRSISSCSHGYLNVTENIKVGKIDELSVTQ